jgi:hypothetical protein
MRVLGVEMGGRMGLLPVVWMARLRLSRFWGALDGVHADALFNRRV